MKKFMKSFLLLTLTLLITCSFIGTSNVEAASVKLSKTKITIYRGESYTLKLKGTSKKAKWSTSNKKVATVTSKGKITAKANGKATIKAKVGSKTYRCTVTVKKQTLSPSKVTLNVGTSQTLKVSKTTKKIKWTSSNKKVATVSSKGKVTAKAKGTTTIKAKFGSYSVTQKIKVESPTISATSTTINTNSTYQLTMKSNTQKVKWTSSNTKIATVDSTGKVKGNSPGTVTITAKIRTKSYKSTIKVENPTINKTSITMYPMDTTTLTVMGTSQSIKWATANARIATVDTRGTVKAMAAGTTSITATVNGKVLTCKVIVNKAGFEKEQLKVLLGENQQLKVYGISNAIFTSSNPNVATISSTGYLTTKNYGETTITATVGTVKYTCKITVVKRMFTQDVYNIYQYHKQYLEFKSVDEERPYKVEISNEKVAYLSSEALDFKWSNKEIILPSSVGTTTLSLYFSDQVLTCTINVKEFSIDQKEDEYILFPGESVTITSKTEFQPTLVMESNKYFTVKGNTITANKNIDATDCSGVGVTVKLDNIFMDTFDFTLLTPEIAQTSMKLPVGNKQILYVRNYDTLKPTWKSSNPSVASVSNTGEITGKKTGTTTISVSFKGTLSTYTLSCKVSVVKDISMKKEEKAFFDYINKKRKEKELKPLLLDASSLFYEMSQSAKNNEAYDKYVNQQLKFEVYFNENGGTWDAWYLDGTITTYELIAKDFNLYSDKVKYISIGYYTNPNSKYFPYGYCVLTHE